MDSSDVRPARLRVKDAWLLALNPIYFFVEGSEGKRSRQGNQQMAGRALVPESPSSNLHTSVCRDLLIPSFQGKHCRPIPRRQQCSVRSSGGTHPGGVVLPLQDPAPPLSRRPAPHRRPHSPRSGLTYRVCGSPGSADWPPTAPVLSKTLPINSAAGPSTTAISHLGRWPAPLPTRLNGKHFGPWAIWFLP